MIATQRGNAAHMPSNHKVHLKKGEKLYEDFHKLSTMITYHSHILER